MINFKINCEFPILQKAAKCNTKYTEARAKSIEENQILYHGHDEGVQVNQQGTMN